jgi:hypothetical protein
MATSRRPAAGRVSVLARTMDRSGKLVRSFVLQPRPHSDDVQADDTGRVLTLQPRTPRAQGPRRISFDHEPTELVQSS